MTSRRSDNLWHSKGKNRECKLQGSLYGLSHDGRIVFSTKLAEAIWLVKIRYYGSPRRLSLLVASLSLGKSQEAILAGNLFSFVENLTRP